VPKVLQTRDGQHLQVGWKKAQNPQIDFWATAQLK
jgi:hypothetical protein